MVRRESGFDLLENFPETGVRELGLTRGPFGKRGLDELRELAHARLDWRALLLAGAPLAFAASESFGLRDGELRVDDAFADERFERIQLEAGQRIEDAPAEWQMGKRLLIESSQQRNAHQHIGLFLGKRHGPRAPVLRPLAAAKRLPGGTENFR